MQFRSVVRVSLLVALICTSASAEATQFTFTLAKDAKTSAGVFSRAGSAAPGTLIKTLWSGVPYLAGTYTKDWDGTDDAGRLVPDETYEIRVLTSNATYTWEGVVGNTSTQKTGPTVFQGYSTISGMAVAGSRAFFGVGYNEGQNSQGYFDLSQFPATSEKTGLSSTGASFFKAASDGTNVYWAGNTFRRVLNGTWSSAGFVMGTPVGTPTQQMAFTTHQSVDTSPMGGRTYDYAIDVVSGPDLAPAYPTGLAAQAGTGGYLFVAWKGENSLHVLDKTGADVAPNTRARQYGAPGDLAAGPVENGVGTLWMIETGECGQDHHQERVVERFSVASDGEVAEQWDVEICGLADPLALAYRDGVLLVADGGGSQQVKAFDSSGSALWQLPSTPGGYADDPTVTSTKFDFEPHLEFTNSSNPFQGGNTPERGTFLAFQDDGSFWVGDTGCYRVQHFSAQRAFLNQLAFVPTFYSSRVDNNDPSRVFANYLEFHVDYSLPLGAANGSWTLVRNWRPGAALGSQGLRMYDVTTLSNGRTYFNKLGGMAWELPALCADDPGDPACGGQAVVTTSEIPASYLRDGILFPDGSVRTMDVLGTVDTVGSVETWSTHAVSFEGGAPSWDEGQELARITRQENDPVEDVHGRFGNMTTGNVIVTFDPFGQYKGWHLGGIRSGTNQFLWRASDSAPNNYRGLWPTDGTFPTTVGNAGSSAMTVDHHIIYGYHGENWSPGLVGTFSACPQTNKFRHYYDDGLFVDEFGVTNVDCSPAAEAMAGNATTPALVKIPDGRTFLYHNDEGRHGGVHRWRIENLSSVAEQTMTVTLQTQTGHGLNAEYFDTPDWNNLSSKMTRVDSQVAFGNWDAGPPGGTGLADDQSFSVRWSGYVVPTVTAVHKFRVATQAPASAQVRVAGKLVAPENGIPLTSGVSYPIVVEYRHVPGTPAPTGPHLKWAAGPAFTEEDVPSAQLLAVLSGTDLMANLPSSGQLPDVTAGWGRSPAADIYEDYSHRWFADISNNSGDTYVHVYRVMSTPGSTAAVTRDLGTPSNLTSSWDLSMMVNYDVSFPNLQSACGQRMEVLDDAGKVIAEFHPEQVSSTDDTRIFGNGATILQSSFNGILSAMWAWHPLRISADAGSIRFAYGDLPPVAGAVMDPSANWRRPKTLRLYYWTNEESCATGHGVDIDDLRLSTNAPAQDVQPLMAGVPSDGQLPDGTAGWGRSPAADYYTDYSHRWFADIMPNDGNPYLHVYSVESTANTTSSVTRDLGNPSSTTASWELSMRANYYPSFVNVWSQCGQRMEVLDDAGKVIADFHSEQVSYPDDVRILGNGATVQQSSFNGILTTMWQWQPLRISAEGGVVSFAYGNLASVSAALKDPTADWRRPKTLRLYYWSNQENCSTGFGVDIDDLQLRTSEHDAAVDLLAGIPADSDLSTWPTNGAYGWTLTPAAYVPPSPNLTVNDQAYAGYNYWYARSNIMTWQKAPPVDLGLVYFKLVNNGSATSPDVVLARDLGTPHDDTTRWELTGRINYFETQLTPYNLGGQNLEVWDDANQLIARFNPPTYLPSWQPIRIVAENGTVTFSYGNQAPIVQSASNWRHAKTLKIVVWKDGGPQTTFGTAYLDDLKYHVTRGENGLVLWLKADELAGQDGDPVSLWVDGSGFAHNALQTTSGSQPILKTGAQGLNGKNVVRFDGVNDFLKSTFPSSAVGTTVFYVARTGSTVPTYEIVLGSGGPAAPGTSGIRWAFGFGTDSWGAGWGGSTGDLPFGAVSGIAANTAYFSQYRKAPTAWTLDGNNTSTISDTSAPSGTFNAYVGSELPTYYFFNGDIAEIQVYNKALSDQECATIKAGLKAKWGLP